MAVAVLIAYCSNSIVNENPQEIRAMLETYEEYENSLKNESSKAKFLWCLDDDSLDGQDVTDGNVRVYFFEIGIRINLSCINRFH